MFSLKNITSFSDFKRMYEASADLGTEYSNKTGFSESLVGRATIGLFKLIKRGIDEVQLEYFKRKLENEYFAGVLRYCKSANIDLKNPQAPITSEEPAKKEENDIVLAANDILLLRFDVGGWETVLTDCNNEIISGMTSIDSGSTEYNDFKLLSDKLIVNVKNINEKFALLNSGSTTLDNDLNAIKTSITEIKSITLSSVTPPVQLKYSLSSGEKSVLDGLVTALSATVPDIATKVLVERYKYEIIEEKVGSGSGTGLGFILGDEISTDGVDKFLKDQGVNNVEDINFKQLASIFTDKMRSTATEKVNKNSIIRIATTVNNIIGDPSKKQALSAGWQKRVETVKGEFKSFLNTNDIDPIELKKANYSPTDDKDGKKQEVADEKAKEISRIGKFINFGPSNGIKHRMKNEGIVRLYRGAFAGTVFNLETAAGLKVYKYLGCIDFDKVITDFDKTKKLDMNTQKYESIFLDTINNGSAPTYLSIKNPKKGKKMELVGIYFIFSNPINPVSTGEYKINKARIFYLYFEGNSASWTSAPANFEIFAVSDTGGNLVKITDMTKLETADEFTIGTGETFEIDDPLKKDFKAPLTKVIPKFLDIPGISIKIK